MELETKAFIYMGMLAEAFLRDVYFRSVADDLYGYLGKVAIKTRVDISHIMGPKIIPEPRIYDVDGDGLDDVVNQEYGIVKIARTEGHVELTDLARQEIELVLEKYSLHRGLEGNYYTESGLHARQLPNIYNSR